MNRENRKRSRVDTGIGARVECEDGGGGPVQVRNLSLKGMLCDSDDKLNRSGPCRLVIELSGGLTVRIDARIVRNDEKGLALDFEGMDEEAFFHLRNIVRLNSPDPDAIDRELASPAYRSSKND